jgi:hypothetical protein
LSQKASEVVNAPLTALAEIYQSMSDSERQKLADELSSLAQKCLRIMTYIDTRCYLGQEHKVAVKRQNSVLRRVRKTLGYFAHNDISF